MKTGKHKTKMAIFLILVFIAIFFLGFFWIWIGRIDYTYVKDSMRKVEGGDENGFDIVADQIRQDELTKKGYEIAFPSFIGSSSMNFDKYAEYYFALTSYGSEYALGVAEKYNNQAVLNFEVLWINGDMTVKFTGFGDTESGEKIPLDKEFSFDMSGDGKDKFPVLKSDA